MQVDEVVVVDVVPVAGVVCPGCQGHCGCKENCSCEQGVMCKACRLKAEDEFIDNDVPFELDDSAINLLVDQILAIQLWKNVKHAKIHKFALEIEHKIHLVLKDIDKAAKKPITNDSSYADELAECVFEVQKLFHTARNARDFTRFCTVLTADLLSHLYHAKNVVVNQEFNAAIRLCLKYKKQVDQKEVKIEPVDLSLIDLRRLPYDSTGPKELSHTMKTTGAIAYAACLQILDDIHWRHKYHNTNGFPLQLPHECVTFEDMKLSDKKKTQIVAELAKAHKIGKSKRVSRAGIDVFTRLRDHCAWLQKHNLEGATTGTEQTLRLTFSRIQQIEAEELADLMNELVTIRRIDIYHEHALHKKNDALATLLKAIRDKEYRYFIDELNEHNLDEDFLMSVFPPEVLDVVACQMIVEAPQANLATASERWGHNLFSDFKAAAREARTALEQNQQLNTALRISVNVPDRVRLIAEMLVDYRELMFPTTQLCETVLVSNVQAQWQREAVPRHLFCDQGQEGIHVLHPPSGLRECAHENCTVEHPCKDHETSLMICQTQFRPVFGVQHALWQRGIFQVINETNVIQEKEGKLPAMRVCDECYLRIKLALNHCMFLRPYSQDSSRADESVEKAFKAMGLTLDDVRNTVTRISEFAHGSSSSAHPYVQAAARLIVDEDAFVPLDESE